MNRPQGQQQGQQQGQKQGQHQVAIIGAGPRGLSVLERLCANERRNPWHSAVTVHVVDPRRRAPARSGAPTSPSTC